MEEIIVKEVGDFKSFVESMNVNVKYLLPKNLRYKWVKIEQGKDYITGETEYGWAMEYNYRMAGSVGYIYPMAGGDKVKSFKTSNGAKRNLIKRYQDYFNSNNQ